MNIDVNDKAPFGKLRSFIWPIYSHEIKKLLPMFMIFFLICFNYNIIKNLKDALVITASDSGAEVIPFLKVWVMFPMAILLTYCFSTLSARFSQESVFYILTSAFLLYFLLFITVLYPIRNTIHPHKFADWLSYHLPIGLRGFVTVIRYWSFSLFYALAELWATIVLSVMFWGFANHVTKLSEAKRFYSVFGIGANISSVAGSQAAIWFTVNNYIPWLPFGQNAWEQTLTVLISIVLVGGLAILAIYRWLHKNVIYPSGIASSDNSKKDKAHSSTSFLQQFKHVCSSRYLLSLGILVLGYNLCINLVEVIWKDQVRNMYPDPSSYNLYINKVTTVMGLIGTFTSVFISGTAIRKLGWKFTALINPVIMAITSVGFFSFLIFGQQIASYCLLSPTSIFSITIFFGAAHNCLSKATKYTLFDATKEMAFIPLDPVERVQGKAAIDGVISRLGKSGGSFIHQLLLIGFASLSMSAPIVSICVGIIISAWISAVNFIDKEFEQKQAVKEQSTLASATS